MERRILLVEPPFYRLYGLSLQKYPLSLGYLSGTLCERSNWDVKTYCSDADFKTLQPLMSYAYLSGPGYENYLRSLHDPSGPVWAEIEGVLGRIQPSVLGISVKTQNFASAALVAGIAKKVNPNVVVVVGGPHPSMVREQVLECAAIDIAVVGEGEETLLDLLDALESGRDLSTVNGIVYRDGTRPVRTPARGYVQDLDKMVFPATWAPKVLVDYEKYPPHAFKSIFASRGCPYGCEFCGSREVWTRKARFRSPQNVVDEIKQLMKMGVKQVHFDDDTFGIRRDWTFEFCDLLSHQCPGITWSCESAVNLVAEDWVDAIRRSGCVSVQLGVESGNNEILRKVAKNTTIEKAYAAVELLRRNGIWTETFFMAGFPYETEETLMDTWRAIKKIKSDCVIFSIFTPYPGTDAFEICRKAGLVGDDYDVSLYNHSSPENCFTPHIDREKFREWTHQIMSYIDRRNKWMKLMSVTHMLRRHGLGTTMKKGFRFAMASFAGARQQST